MIRALLNITLLVLILFHTFEKVYIVLSFESNRDYITTALCINRDKPEMLCSGKCYLVEKLSQNQDQGKALPIGSKIPKDNVYTPTVIVIADIPYATATFNERKPFQYKEKITKGISLDLFRPPKSIV
ncbi:MAG: hypothetical protein IPL23_12180 [Saprospiraceae bacterium]|nr:hypothetical protein [Saprospiraceae bacterium]HMS69529.1 hypothetical protein [Saprospiraceae bacterium]